MKTIKIANLILLLMFFIVLVSCDKEDEQITGEFSIYLFDKDILENGDVELDDLILEDTPMITGEDVLTYNWKIHMITYSERTYTSIHSVHDSLVSKGFVVMVGDERIYYGYFLNGIESWIVDRPVILLDWWQPGLGYLGFKINRSYPDSEEFWSESDSRSDTRIYNALKKSGKLVE